MGLFKKKDDTKVMGYIMSEACFVRINQCLELTPFNQEEMILQIYACSSAIIADGLKRQYIDKTIIDTLRYSDDFFFKKYRDLKNEEIDKKLKTYRDEWLKQMPLDIDRTVNQLCESLVISNKDKLKEMIHSWYSSNMLIKESKK